MKKLKMQKGYKLTVGIMIFMMLFTACAKRDNKNSYDMNYSNGTNETTASEPAAGEYQDTAKEKEEELPSTANFTMGGIEALSMEKIIRRVTMEIETLEFDDLIQSIDSEIIRLGGYVESSKVSGRRYYSSHEQRYGNIIVRIPKEKLDEFVGNVYDAANVVNKSEDIKNVTLEYVDTESRKKSLEIEQERLFALLEKSDSLEGIITLESRLSDIRYELQNYETRLRTIDNQVDYSTVTMSIAEVERISVAEDDKGSVFSRMKTGFNDTMYDIGEGLKNFFVWFVVNLPYLLIWAGIITAVIFIIRRYYKKHYRKNEVSLNQKYLDSKEEKDDSKNI